MASAIFPPQGDSNTTTSTTPPPTAPLTTTLLTHTQPSYTFTFTPFLQKTYQHSLPASRPICKAYQSGSCPLRSHCSERHISLPSTSSTRHNDSGNSFGSLVCKHWLRGLCKKGESCEFLHEYNLRKMPECNFFVRNGYCSNGDECLYLHIDPQSKLPPCPHYDRGFCPLGPRCDKKHVRRKLCPFYLAGFCPEGSRLCKAGTHARWTNEKDMERPRVREEKPKVEEGEKDGMGQGQGGYGGGGGGLMSERDREERDIQASRDRGGNRGDREGGGHDRGRDGHKGFGGGGRGRGGHGWRGSKGGRFRGRGGHDRGGH